MRYVDSTRIQTRSQELILLINAGPSLCRILRSLSVWTDCDLGWPRKTARKLALPAHTAVIKKLYARGTTVRDARISVVTIKLIAQFARPICPDKDRLLACRPLMTRCREVHYLFHNFVYIIISWTTYVSHDEIKLLRSPWKQCVSSFSDNAYSKASYLLLKDV